jgi:hypothetical protein
LLLLYLRLSTRLHTAGNGQKISAKRPKSFQPGISIAISSTTTYLPVNLFLDANIQYAAYDKKSLSDVGKVVPTASSGVVPHDSPQPVHYQEEDEPKAEHTKPSVESEANEPVPTAQQKANGQVGQMRFEEVVYRDEHGNVLDDEALAKLVAEQGDNIEFKTIYETKTKTLLPGEEPPPGARRIPVGDEKVDVPVYPDGQNPETAPADDGGEKKAYRT